METIKWNCSCTENSRAKAKSIKPIGWNDESNLKRLNTDLFSNEFAFPFSLLPQAANLVAFIWIAVCSSPLPKPKSYNRSVGVLLNNFERPKWPVIDLSILLVDNALDREYVGQVHSARRSVDYGMCNMKSKTQHIIRRRKNSLQAFLRFHGNLCQLQGKHCCACCRLPLFLDPRVFENSSGMTYELREIYCRNTECKLRG